MSNALIIFIRNPIPGKVKTRLALTLGDANALHIYKQLLKHTHKISLAVGAERFLFYDEYIDRADEWENEHFNKQLQSGNDLGEKMDKLLYCLLPTLSDIDVENELSSEQKKQLLKKDSRG
ncbi:MAG TPA: hypothetical protein VNI52_04375 [Sphingobacteriaceae bacterium]|nr:hypothetical protein [Sphingobacteriaceae bacterium]